jgi:hypothetical protein
MESAIQKLAIVNFFVIGLSHIVQPRVWAQFFIDIREKGAAGSFIVVFIHFPLGALIVAFHNIWHGWPMILTFIGYGLVFKSLVHFVFPQRALKSLSWVSLEKTLGICCRRYLFCWAKCFVGGHPYCHYNHR